MVSFILGQCQTILGQYNNVFITLFLAGLVGGVTHCMGMCGPFVLSQATCSSDRKVRFDKISSNNLLLYHLGRMTSYVFLGFTVAILSRQIMGTAIHRWVSILFLTLAGVIFILTAFPHKKNIIIPFPNKYISHFKRVIEKISKPLLMNVSKKSSYLLGILLGFLPCGLIFAILMIVSTIGNPYIAIIAMMFFTIGTMPSLILVWLGGSLALGKWPKQIQILTRGIMVINGISLFSLAGKIFLFKRIV